MSWIDDEIQEIERLKLRKEQNDEKIRERERILQAQAESSWLQLKEKFAPLVASFNQSSGRALLEMIDVSTYGFVIRREDYVTAEVRFDNSTKKATVCYLPTLSGHDKSYSVCVMPINGTETPVWLNAQSRTREFEDQIAALTVRTSLALRAVGRASQNPVPILRKFTPDLGHLDA